jgi:hypothetical protein
MLPYLLPVVLSNEYDYISLYYGLLRTYILPVILPVQAPQNEVWADYQGCSLTFHSWAGKRTIRQADGDTRQENCTTLPWAADR